MKITKTLAAALTAAFVISAAGAAGFTAVTAVSIVTASEAHAERLTWKQKQAKRRALLKKLQKDVRNRTRYVERGQERAADPALLSALDRQTAVPAAAVPTASPLQLRTSWTTKVTGPGLLPFGGEGSSKQVYAPDYVPEFARVTTISWTTQVFNASSLQRVKGYAVFAV